MISGRARGRRASDLPLERRNGRIMSTLATGAVPGIARARSRLLWTDWIFLLAVAAAATVAVDPLELKLASNPVAKHLALMTTVPVVLLALAGRKVRVPWLESPYSGRLAGALWPLLALGLLVLAGSLYARFVLGIQNTFMNVGLYMLVTWCAGAMVLASDDPGALARWYFRILIAAGVVMGVFLIANFRTRQVYHEQIFLVIPLAALFFVQTHARVLRWLGTIFFLLMAWLSVKYTSYIIGAFTVLYLMAIVAYPRLASRPKLYRTTAVYWSVVGVVAFAITAVLFAAHDPSGLPSGNPEYRMHTYAAAWERFKTSPVWGTLFAVESVEKFKLFGIGIADNVLPTHSDVLDLLANGGIIAILLWVWGLARAGRIAWRGLLQPALLGHPWAPYAHVLAVMSAAGVLTYAFNPILLQPALAYLLWTNLGLLVGLSLRADGKI